MSQKQFRITAAPFVRAAESTTTIMWSVVLSLLPAIAAGIYFFGPSAALVIIASCAGCLVTEGLLSNRGWRSLTDGSGLITGLLLGMALPPGLPMWMAFIGGAFGMGFGKLIFGGLGQNIFNPALLGRAFLQAAFPVALTTWTVPAEHWWHLRGDNLAWPLMSSQFDGQTGATPLGMIKFEGIDSPVLDLFLGSTGGSVGEGSALLILAGGLYLAWRGHLNWQIPASILLTVALMSGLFHLIDPSYPGPLFMLCSGGLMLGAFYMATDMVTSPITTKGCWLFGIGIGVIVVTIRYWGGLPEGMMYAILLMNTLVPFINRISQPRVFGARTAK
jgi:electron transport complex protein RnfD